MEIITRKRGSCKEIFKLPSSEKFLVGGLIRESDAGFVPSGLAKPIFIGANLISGYIGSNRELATNPTNT